MDGADWNLASQWDTNPLGAFVQGQQAASSGIALRQQAGAAHALQGIDLNNPGSLDAGIGNLVHANALDQAKALQDLSFTRWQRSQVPGILQHFLNRGQQPSPDAPQTAEAPAQDPQQIIGTWTTAKNAADHLAALPEAERPAAFAQIKADLLKQGIPEAAIDSAGQHLTGDGPQQLSQYYGGLIDHAQHQLSGSTEPGPPVPAAHPSTAWYNDVTGSPDASIESSLLKSWGGIDMSPYLDMAKSLATPGITEAARAQYAGPIAEATATAQKNIDVKYGPTLALIDAFKAGRIADAELPAAIRKAQADAEITAGHTLTQQPQVDADGNPTGRTVQTTVADAIGASSGKHPPVAQSPQEAARETDDMKNFADKMNTEATGPAIASDMSSRDKALAAARMAQSVHPSNLTPVIGDLTNTLNAFHVPLAAGKANSVATYQNLIAQNLKSAIAVFPRNQQEMEAIEKAGATTKMPGDAAALALTMTAAVYDQAAKYKQSRLDYFRTHPSTEQRESHFQSWYSKEGPGSQSIFASPVFRDLKFDGKPAVAVMQHPYKDGHVYGVFMPGTPQKTVFRVR